MDCRKILQQKKHMQVEKKDWIDGTIKRCSTNIILH